MNCKLSEGAIDGATLGTKLGASLRSKLGTSLGTKLGKSLGISETGTILGAIVKTTVSLPTSSRTRLLHGHQKLLGKNAPPASAKFSSTNSTLASQTCVEMEEEEKAVESVRTFSVSVPLFLSVHSLSDHYDTAPPPYNQSKTDLCKS